jgi:predicted DNA-binding protein
MKSSHTYPVSVRLVHSARQQIRMLAGDLSKPQAHVVGELIKMGLTSEEDIVESVSLRLASRRMVREQEARR